MAPPEDPRAEEARRLNYALTLEVLPPGQAEAQGSVENLALLLPVLNLRGG